MGGEELVRAVLTNNTEEKEIGMSEEYLKKAFTYHPPTGTQPERYVLLRDLAKGFAEGVLKHCPESRERSLALTNIEQAVMWANASIARNGTFWPHRDADA